MAKKIYDESDKWYFIITTIIVVCYIGIATLCISGAFESPMNKLDLDKNELAASHVLEYYPEYENCSFRYKTAPQIDCKNNIPGVEVLCEQVEDRDGMNVLGNNPTLTLCFDDITLEEIFEDRILEYK